MPKSLKHFRLSSEHIAVLAKYQQDHKLASMTEALEQILNSLSFLPDKVLSGASDLLPCKQRVTIANELSCMNPPTLYKKVKITEITPEICRACQVLSKNLPTKYEMTQPQTLEASVSTSDPAGQDSFERVRDPANIEQMRSGKVWCPEGLWVFPNKCDRCKERTYAHWYDCQKEKFRKRGEQERIASNV